MVGLRGQKNKARTTPKSTATKSSVIEQFAQKEQHQTASMWTVLLIITVLAAVCVLVFPIRSYFHQAAKISSLNSEHKRVLAEKKYWEKEATRGTDEKYIIAYAREHNALIMPGETAMLVTNPDAVGTDKDIEKFDEENNADSQFSSEALTALKKLETPWYQKIAESFISINQGAQ